MMKKITSLTVALLLVAGVFGAVTASAATVEELQALIAQLQSQLTSLGGASAPATTGGYTFNTDMTVGSRIADVTKLQEMLNTEVNAGLPTTGYFGALTKAAVKKFQTANGIPSTGYVGPMTRAKLNELAGPVVVPPTTGDNTGTTGNTGGTASLDKTDGSVTVSQGTYVTSSQTLKKGDTKDVLSADLKAVTGKVAVNRFDVYFTVKPWLYFSKVTLKDASGNVIATKDISSSADATEITTNSKYLVRFDGISNVVVEPGTTKTLVVGLTVLSATDKIAANGTSVTVNVGSNGIRTVNGLGYSDTPATSDVTSSLTLSGTANAGDIYTRISPSAPLARSVAISTTQTTSDVPLTVYSLKSQNQDSKITGMSFTLQTDPAFAKTGMFSNIRIKDGDKTYAGSLTDAGAIAFSNLNLALTKDQWKDLTLLADIAATSSSVVVKASTTLTASSIVGSDVNDNTATISGGNQTSADVTLTNNSMSVSGLSATAGNGVADTANGPVVRYPNARYTFTLTNNSSNDLYVSADVSTMVSTSTTPTNASSTIDAIVSPTDTVNGDVAGTAYIIRSGGGTRTFVLGGTIKKSSNASAKESLKITAIKYGAASTNTTSQSISTGLGDLNVLVGF